MARRRSGAVEDLLELTSKLPWWVGVALAVISFVILRGVASVGSPQATDIRDVGGMVVRQAVRSVAAIVQWILPAIFLIAAAVSAAKRKRRVTLHDTVVGSGARALHEMSWPDFERLVGEYFRRRGFLVLETGGGAPDGGVDLVLSRGTDRYVVQCKQWRAVTVGVEPVRELYGVMAARRAAGAFLVTAGSFTREAKRFAAGREVELIDGSQLASAVQAQARSTTAEGAPSGERLSPTCPSCGATMVLRKARRGGNAGGTFWGCSEFPRCRRTLPAADFE